MQVSVLQALEQLHFIRPEWFYALIPLFIFYLLFIRLQQQGRNWQAVIDPKLLPHLLVGKSVKQKSVANIVFPVCGILLITSLAGPAWQKRPQPVFKEKSALVIALDLSRSMDAADIKPSRLTRARHKIVDILKQRKLGQTALIVYAAGAFVVSPLTDDTATITALLESLSTAMMPAQGTRTDKAIQLAANLLNNAAIKHGDILLVTDDIEKSATKAFKKIASKHRISILAVATEQGAPIPLPSGGFVKDNHGAIVVPMLDIKQLQQFHKLGKGRFSIISADDTDISNLTAIFNKSRFEAEQDKSSTNLQADSWYEQGPWLLLLILPFSLYFFRKGIIFVLAFVLLQQPHTAEAGTFWENLWQTPDQQAAKKLQQKQAAEAAKLFKDPQWKAAASYRSKQYQQTIKNLEGIETADAHYNKGNAYAQLGQTEQAIKEYAEALKLNPQHKDAQFNKQLLEKQQQSQKSKNNKNQQSEKQSQSKSNSDKNKTDKSKQGQKKDNKGQQSQNQNQQQQGNKQKQQQQDKTAGQGADKDKNKKTKSDEQKEQNKQTAEAQKQDKAKGDKPNKESASAEKQQQDAEDKKAQRITKQWLRRIPDDPGGLMRNKFRYQYNRQKHGNEKQTW